MSSTAQILANRANASLSTGPKTDAGKLASSRNATRHGLTGKQIVMPGEDAAAYDTLRADLYASYNPANEAERVLVDQVATSTWRLERAQKIEAAVLTKLTGEAASAVDSLGGMFLEEPAQLVRLQRYVTQFERAYFRTIKELQLLQRSRAKAEEVQATAKAKQSLIDTWLAGRASRPAEPEIGFVSQTSLSTPNSAQSTPSDLAKAA